MFLHPAHHQKSHILFRSIQPQPKGIVIVIAQGHRNPVYWIKFTRIFTRIVKGNVQLRATLAKMAESIICHIAGYIVAQTLKPIFAQSEKHKQQDTQAVI